MFQEVDTNDDEKVSKEEIEDLYVFKPIYEEIEDLYV